MKKIAVTFIFVFQALFYNLAIAKEENEERVIQVSAEEALALEKSLANQKDVKIERILLTQNTREQEDCSKILNPEKKKECLKIPPAPEVGNNIEANNDGNVLEVVRGMGSGGGRDAALIVFAVIGIVVLVIWIPYTVRFIYKFFRGNEVSGWITLSTSYVNLKDTLQTPSLRRDGELYGINMLLVMGDEGGHMGLVVEGGQYSLSDTNPLTGVESKSKDAYLMGGPSLLYGFKEFNGSLDLIGGKGFGENTGLMSKATLGLNLTYSKIYFGLQFGALYSKINDLSGVAKDIDCYQLFAGIKLGITF